MSRKGGKYIVIEGIDGAGKSTQVQLLAEFLTHAGYSTLVVREPSFTALGRMVRSLWNRGTVSSHVAALLFAADTIHAQETKDGTCAALADGTIVISDRSYLSTYAYLMADCSLKWLDSIHQGCVHPDLTIILDLDVEIAIDRLRFSRYTLHQYETVHDLHRVRGNYRKLRGMKAHSDGCLIVRVGQDETVDGVHLRIRGIVESLLAAQQRPTH